MYKRLSSIFMVVLLAIIWAGSVQASDVEKTNLAQMKKFYAEVVNKGNLDLMDEMCTENFTENEVLPGAEPGLAGVKQFFGMLRTAFPDLKFEIDQMIAKDDKVVTQITITGTHKGEFMGTPASGNKISVKTIDIVRFEDGKAAEHWGVTDTMSMMQQMGAFPEETPKE